MSVEQTNLAAVEKWAALYNSDPHRMIDECYAPDPEVIAPEELHITDSATFHEMERAAFQAMPDRHSEMLSTVAVGDKVFIEGVMTGSNPATGAPLKVRWCSVLTFVNGLITEDRTYMDWSVFKDFVRTAEYRDVSVPAHPSASDISDFYDLSSQALCELWDESFHAGYFLSDDDDSSNRVAADRMTDLLIDRLGLTGGRMLDVGCGIGAPALRLAGTCTAEITGISINKAQVDEANRRAASGGVADRVRFQYADALAMPFEDATYDAAWAFESLIHMDRIPALREISRVVKPGARLVVADLLQTGPLTPEEQELVRDGLERMSASPILTEDQYRELVAEAGWEIVEFLDVSKHAVKTQRRMIEAVETRYDEMIERFGPEVSELMDLMLSPAGLLPQMGYLVAVLRKPL
ncbi:methyltransferase domain-containing protein [Streptosporangium sp. NPDC051023]|uniref:methyltransferase domain-containing protein n=1 Tax=Streptosporangium sp. NPDC051023 TaxID=3155410 RepID=UPI00344D2E78